MSSAIRKAKELYFVDESKSSPNQSSLRRDKSWFKNYEDSAIKNQKIKQSPYVAPPLTNYYFQQPQVNGVRMIKQHNIARKHVDNSNPSNSFHYWIPNQMFSPSNSKKQMNNSAIIEKPNQQLHKSRRMNWFRSGSNKSRDQNHYRINSSSNTNKAIESKSSSMVQGSDLTPLNSNYIKTVKTKNTEDTLMGSNVYKISTMENSIKKMNKKSLNLSSNHYHEYPTTTDWHSSLINGQDENIEEVHFYFVLLHQKKKKLIERIEKLMKNPTPSDMKRQKSKSKNRAQSAKRRKNELQEKSNEDECNQQIEFISQRNSNVDLWAQEVFLE